MAEPQRCHQAGGPVPVVDAKVCTGCGLCALACPCGAVSMSERLPQFACATCCTHNDQCPVICAGIHPCEVSCPERAISVVFVIQDLSERGGM